jgi:hypothetical protein
LRTCFVTLSQHFMLPGAAALGEVVVVDVCAVAIPIAPASIAAAINAVPVIRMRRILSELQISLGVLRRDLRQREDGATVPPSRVTKKEPRRRSEAPSEPAPTCDPSEPKKATPLGSRQLTRVLISRAWITKRIPKYRSVDRFSNASAAAASAKDQ